MSAEILPSASNSATHPLPSAENIFSSIDQAISLTLHLWPALDLAVTNEWGGPDSSDKRDWFAGAISDLFLSRPNTDQMDLEHMMEQVMGDEFECVVEDGSLEEAAGNIVRLRSQCLRGQFGDVETLTGVWEERRRTERVVGGSANANGAFRKVEVDQETDGDDDDDDDGENGDEKDIVMGEAPELVKTPRQRVGPEIDEDGFTKVVGRKKR